MSNGQAKLRIRDIGNICETDYVPLLSTPIINNVKTVLTKPTKIEESKDGNIKVSRDTERGKTIVNIKNGDNSEFRITISDGNLNKRVTNGIKLLNFLLAKANEHSYSPAIKFNISEIVDAGMYKNKDAAVIGLRSILSKMSAIALEGKVVIWKNGKSISPWQRNTYLIKDYTTSYTECSVEFAPILLANKAFYTIMPYWSYSLSDDAYLLIDYIYTLARMNSVKMKESGKFNISLNKIRDRMGLPSAEEVKSKYSRCYQQRIVNPIEAAVEEIEDKLNALKVNSLQMELVCDCESNDINIWLRGFLEISMNDKSRDYMLDRLPKSATVKRKTAHDSEVA